MVLFSIVYFYSSPTRFVIVSALGLMLYLWVWTVWILPTHYITCFYKIKHVYTQKLNCYTTYFSSQYWLEYIFSS
jgi:membrane protein YdbS with pleckstrin-like domain